MAGSCVLCEAEGSQEEQPMSPSIPGCPLHPTDCPCGKLAEGIAKV